jgi:outer membrane protein assembly factor BamB
MWPAGGPRLEWTVRGIGHGFATVAIAGGRIYTSGNRDGKTIVSALDLDGRTVWQVENGEAWEASVPGSRGTPTIDGGRLYHESPLGNVVCLDAKTGRKRWGLNILDEFHGKNINWALAESLLVDGDRVVCCPGGPETAMVALDKHTGRTVWKSPSAGDLAGYASPSLGEYQGLRMIFTLTSRAAIAVDADRGDLLWRFEQVTPFDENIGMPIYHDGHVLVSTRTTGTVLLALHVDGRKCSVREVWRCKELDNQHGGLVLLEGYVYGSSHVNSGGKWISLDWATGKVMYLEHGVGKGSLTYADGMFYTMSENRAVGLVKATPDRHDVVSAFKIPEGGEGPTWAHPVVCGGRLYIRHGDFLYAYDVRSTER